MIEMMKTANLDVLLAINYPLAQNPPLPPAQHKHLLEVVLGVIARGEDFPLKAIYVTYSFGPLTGIGTSAEEGRNVCLSLGGSYLRLLQETRGKPCFRDLFSKRAIESVITVLVDSMPDKYAPIVFEMLTGGDDDLRSAALFWVSRTNLAFVVREKQIPLLIEMSDSMEPDVSAKAANLLTRVTNFTPPLKNGKQVKGSWAKWWKAEKAGFSVIGTAISIAGDRKLPEKARGAAFGNLSLGGLAPADDARRVSEFLKGVALDRTETLPIRRAAISAISWIPAWCQDPEETAKKFVISYSN